MAIQAQVYQENLGFPCLGGDMIESDAVNSENQSGCGHNLNSNPQFYGFQQKQQQLHISQQGKEFDMMLQCQNQRLRMALQEQRKHQMAALMKKIESKAQFIVSQKDQEIARAAQRTTELHDLLQKMEMESQAWQRVAQENEAMVASLNNTIDELMKDRACSYSPAGGAAAESCCDENREYRAGVVGALNPCMNCNSRGSCMLFLPCRHLGSCRECEVYLGFCPVCKTDKKATVEVLIS